MVTTVYANPCHWFLANPHLQRKLAELCPEQWNSQFMGCVCCVETRHLLKGSNIRIVFFNQVCTKLLVKMTLDIFTFIFFKDAYPGFEALYRTRHFQKPRSPVLSPWQTQFLPRNWVHWKTGCQTQKPSFRKQLVLVASWDSALLLFFPDLN